jgi:homoserine dehydrogenase
MDKPIAVIKLGSSVLVDASCVSKATRELKACVQRGNKVLAVVSAFAGETDRLFAAVAEVDTSADPHRVADFVATGEQQCACLLRIALESSDIPAKAISPRDCRLLADGDALDADPYDVDINFLHVQFDRVDVVVIPGFVACDSEGRTVLLGRGGSDDTALYLAQRLEADCRLVKDVDGIFEFDPARPGPRPRQYKTITWRDALAVAGVLVQPKAIRFAETHSMSFTVLSLVSNGGTTVGSEPTLFRS